MLPLMATLLQPAVPSALCMLDKYVLLMMVFEEGDRDLLSQRTSGISVEEETVTSFVIHLTNIY